MTYRNRWGQECCAFCGYILPQHGENCDRPLPFEGNHALYVEPQKDGTFLLRDPAFMERSEDVTEEEVSKNELTRVERQRDKAEQEAKALRDLDTNRDREVQKLRNALQDLVDNVDPDSAPREYEAAVKVLKGE